MARKLVPAQESSQLGFGFGVIDNQGNTPPFITEPEEAYRAIAQIEKVEWASVDVETTGLTEASGRVMLTPAMLKQGASNQVRMRTIQVRIPSKNGGGPRINFGFDVDAMGPELTKKVAQAVLSRRAFIAHNAGFDLYWLRRAQGRTVMPEFVLDTMLLTRLLEPKLVLKRAELISDVKNKHELLRKGPVVQAAWDSLVKGSSGGSLADVVLAAFNTVVDKTYQRPVNWTGILGFEHYQYAIDDVVWGDRIISRLLGLRLDQEDVLSAYLAARKLNPLIALIEPQVPDLVRLRETGMPTNLSVGEKFVFRKRKELAKMVDTIIDIEPTLEKHRDLLADPDAGLSAELKKTLAEAFTNRGVNLRRTEATGTPQVGEKDLRACRAAQIPEAKPLFSAWVAICKAKKTSAMAVDVMGFAERSDDGRLHSLMSHGPITGRLSASEPNCFTPDTEILTENGWVFFDRLDKTAKVAQYRDKEISFVTPTAHICHEWDGELVALTSGYVSQVSTPDHRCRVEDPESGQEIVLNASQYPSGLLQRHGAYYTQGEGVDMTDLELRFMVMFQACGREDPQGGYVIRLRSADKINRINTLFNSVVCKKISQGPLGEVFFLSPSNSYIQKAVSFLENGKRFGKNLLNLTQDQLLIVVDEIAYWDGLKNITGNAITYSSNNKKDADWVQILFNLTGHKTRLRRREKNKTTGKLYKITGSRSGVSSSSQVAKQQFHYKGKVYCVSVDSGFIVIRHNGKVMVTGNCQQYPRDQLFRAMCMSPIKPGMETLTITVAPYNLDYVSEVLDVPQENLVPGQVVALDTAWAAAMFYTLGSVHSWPREVHAEFSNYLNSHFTHMIIASDFGALDVRVGAALCIRAQREMLALAKGVPVPSQVQPPAPVVETIKKVVAALDPSDSAKSLKALKALEIRYKAATEKTQETLNSLRERFKQGDLERRSFFTQRKEHKDILLRRKLGWRLAQCLYLATQRGETDYSGLRDAFVADIDIHTFTGMNLNGRDPMKEFEGLSPQERKELEKVLKKELGPRRQQGKIANLSLLYGMEDAGFQEAAARGYDEHWTLEEASNIRKLWMNSYPEVELWHLWTECMPMGTVYLPEGGEKRSRVDWYLSRTLSGREIVAFGLNSALSYQDQSSGADILGLIMHRLQTKYNDIFQTSINQVHDEQVFAVPMEKFEEYLPIIERVMVEEANSQTMPYGVPTAVSPASGPLWVKD